MSSNLGANGARPRIAHCDEQVGRRIFELRTQQRISQRQLSFPGCSAAYISRIEAGDRTPSLQLLEEIGRRLGASANWLAWGAERDDGGNWKIRALTAERKLRLAQARIRELEASGG